MGLSGSGRSTSLRLLNGLLEPTAGHVRFDGRDLTAIGDRELREVRAKKISMVFQHFALFPHRSVLENAAYGLAVQGVPRAERETGAAQALELCGLGGGRSPGPTSCPAVCSSACASPAPFAGDNPEVGEWLKNFSMTEKQLTGLESQITKAGKGKDAVRTWLKQNPGLLDKWAPVALSGQKGQAAG